MKQREIGLYIHIPFCKQKCNYCDFCSYENKTVLIPKYIKCIQTEIMEVAKTNNQTAIDVPFLVKTIYIGGGTPSFVDSKYIVEIIKSIKENYKIDENVEITIEVNPGTVNEEKLKDYIEVGINRLSIGLQSTYDVLLKQIGRIHTYQEFLNTYYMARQIGFENINVDLILGLPNQTVQEIQNSVEEIIGLEPEHISLYSLIVEEGTKLQKQLQNGEIILPNETEERKMYWKCKQILEENEYIHYEISNFAKQGYMSKHNSDCWEQKEYIGFGVSAHSYTDGVRYSNIENIEEYIKNYENKKPQNNFVFHEKQNLDMKQKEFMLLGLRKIQGVSIQEFKKKFVANPIYLYRKNIEKLSEQQLIEIDGDYIKMTSKGIDFANIVWEEFV